MTNTVEPTVDWSQDQMVEVLLNEPDDFLKVREKTHNLQREETISNVSHPAQAGKIFHRSL